MKFLIVCIQLILLVSASAVASLDLRVGGKNFTEQFLLVSMTEQYLNHQGYSIKKTTGLGTVVMRKALESNQLDLVWDYTGTGLIVYYHIQEKLTGLASYEKIRDLDKKNDLLWLEPSKIDNGYALTMQKNIADNKKIKTISDLSSYLKENKKSRHIFALDYEFSSRPDGLLPLQAEYKLNFSRGEVLPMDPGLVYTALRNGQVFVGLAFTSDGRIKGFDLVALEDDKKYFPSYFATPVVRKEILDKMPNLLNDIKEISSRLDTLKMMELNKKVDIDHMSVEKVARDFLQEEGLLK